MAPWRPPAGRGSATSFGLWSSGSKWPKMTSILCFGSIHILGMRIPKKKVCNFVGGVVSPILANLYLHHALDVWFAEVVQPHCDGQALLCRYADDFVCAFQYKRDAERFYR